MISIVVLLVIFVILFFILWYISTCGTFILDNLIFLDSLFGAAAIIYFLYILFIPGDLVWKIIIGFILLLFIITYIQRVRDCRNRFRQ